MRLTDEEQARLDALRATYNLPDGAQVRVVRHLCFSGPWKAVALQLARSLPDGLHQHTAAVLLIVTTEPLHDDRAPAERPMRHAALDPDSAGAAGERHLDPFNLPNSNPTTCGSHDRPDCLALPRVPLHPHPH